MFRSNPATESAKDGRLFNFYTEPDLKAALASIEDIEVVHIWTTDDRGSPDRPMWTNGLVRRVSG